MGCWWDVGVGGMLVGCWWDVDAGWKIKMTRV